MTESLPTDFKHLKPTELYRSAIEDFALVVDEADKNKKNVLLAAFVEGGVSWNDYVAQHPEVAPPAPTVVTSTPTSNTALTAEGQSPVEPVVEQAGRVIVAETPVYNPADKLLVKMERDNPVFQSRGYTFTRQNPYALMSPADADNLIRNEVGFRQALPSELAEFYG